MSKKANKDATTSKSKKASTSERATITLPCNACYETGKRIIHIMKVCPKCKGTQEKNKKGKIIICSKCDGGLLVVKYRDIAKCKVCDGTKTIEKDRNKYYLRQANKGAKKVAKKIGKEVLKEGLSMVTGGIARPLVDLAEATMDSFDYDTGVNFRDGDAYGNHDDDESGGLSDKEIKKIEKKMKQLAKAGYKYKTGQDYIDAVNQIETRKKDMENGPSRKNTRDSDIDNNSNNGNNGTGGCCNIL